mmetsp:Transcript_4295/g.8475  ORF Transcript_4295/g.8475 Transcript_4295/m.8475 type:complete len:89 (-) Transcript_4295:640-906(-)
MKLDIGGPRRETFNDVLSLSAKILVQRVLATRQGLLVLQVCAALTKSPFSFFTSNSSPLGPTQIPPPLEGPGLIDGLRSLALHPFLLS